MRDRAGVTAHKMGSKEKCSNAAETSPQRENTLGWPVP